MQSYIPLWFLSFCCLIPLGTFPVCCAPLFFYDLQDFVPTKDLGEREKYEMQERRPENGGVSPRFSARIRNPSSNPPMDGFEKQFSRVLHKVQQTIENNEMRLAGADRREVIKVEWQQVALVVDRVLLTLFMGLTIGVTLGIVLQSPHSRTFMLGLSDPVKDQMQDNSDNG